MNWTPVKDTTITGKDRTADWRAIALGQSVHATPHRRSCLGASGRLILQMRWHKGQSAEGVVYTDGKMLPPPAGLRF